VLLSIQAELTIDVAVRVCAVVLILQIALAITLAAHERSGDTLVVVYTGLCTSTKAGGVHACQVTSIIVYSAGQNKIPGTILDSASVVLRA
jgi:hypothetical protein